MIGLLGGAFDPPHNGHLALARTAIGHFALEQLVVLVVAAPGHRRVVTSPEIRLRLAEAAFGDLPRATVELDEHAFTVDLLREGRFHEPLVLIGADQLAAFATWKEPDEVLRLARLGVATRPTHGRSLLEGVLAGLEHPERVELFELEPLPISSSDIRARIARGQTSGGTVPAPVERTIAAFGLYRDG
ncbi:MAG: nicotinate-nicotinamide nucleotide adenylyltransferase [Actinobacteria bacterium]|nr:nicotinate-nicotinamide nucleotide adenylyltransferase [Actinomycetota bacterium]